MTSQLTARDNGDGTATITFTVESMTITSTGDRESILDQLAVAEAALRWTPSRAAEQRRRLWELATEAARCQLGNASPARIRVASEEWDNGHFASDTIDLWFSDTTARNSTPDAQIELTDLSCEIDFDVFDGCCEGQSWELDISRHQVAATSPVAKAS